MFLALLEISFRTLQPVFLATPIALGGLGLDPPVIGTIMSFSGVLNGVFTVLFFPRMVEYFGVKRVYLMGVTAAVPCFSLFPIVNHLARKSIEGSGGLGVGVWAVVGLQVVMGVLMCSCYGASASKKSNCRFIYLFPSFQVQYTSSSPPLRPTKPRWGPRMGSHKCRGLSCVRLDLP